MPSATMSKAKSSPLLKGATEILADLLLCDETAVTPGALLVKDLGMDSLDRVEIVMQLEEKLLAGGAIDEEEAEGWKTVGDVFRTIETANERKTAREPAQDHHA